MSRGRVLLWLLPALLYGSFWAWYTPLGGPLGAAEVRDILARFDADGRDPGELARLRGFLEQDSGGQIVMINLLDLADAPPSLPATGPDAPAMALLDHYMAHMYPELLKRASHPVFMGAAVAEAMDVVGIEGARQWSTAALMRYRSRRDLMEIATHPGFADRHEYKLAALDKTIAFPVEPQLYLSDPRWLLALLLIAVVALTDVLTFGRGRG